MSRGWVEKESFYENKLRSENQSCYRLTEHWYSEAETLVCEEPLSSEWKFNKDNKTKSEELWEPPKLCLALSCGGLRSAAFSIGVLQGLQELKVLDRVDVVSVVSGGSYALSWFYAQQYHAHAANKQTDLSEVRKKMFDDNGSYQEYLTKNAKLLYLGEGVPHFFVSLLASPINILFNVAVGWHVNTTPSQAVYEDKLRALFLRDGHEKSSQVTITFPELRKFIEDQNLPFLIINTTALIGFVSKNCGRVAAQAAFQVHDILSITLTKPHALAYAQVGA